MKPVMFVPCKILELCNRSCKRSTLTGFLVFCLLLPISVSERRCGWWVTAKLHRSERPWAQGKVHCYCLFSLCGHEDERDHQQVARPETDEPVPPEPTGEKLFWASGRVESDPSLAFPRSRSMSRLPIKNVVSSFHVFDLNEWVKGTRRILGSKILPKKNWRSREKYPKVIFPKPIRGRGLEPKAELRATLNLLAAR